MQSKFSREDWKLELLPLRRSIAQYPESVRLGIEHGQFDTGWLVLHLLEKWRLASNLGVPRGDGLRDDLLF
jgi:hypothetical protein